MTREEIIALAKQHGAVTEVLAMGRSDGVLFTLTSLKPSSTQHRSWRGRELLTIWSTDLSMTRATIFSMPKPSATGATSNNNRR